MKKNISNFLPNRLSVIAVIIKKMENKFLNSPKSFFFLTLIFLLGWIFYELSSFDLLLQDKLYNFETCKWVVDRNEPLARAIFYKGIKWALAFFGIGSFILFILGLFKGKPRRYQFNTLYFFLCMAIIPLTISSSKSLTNVYCPWDLARYGGDVPYVKVYDSYPESFRPKKIRPECFPAGHASGGFALFSLFFIAKNRRQRFLSLIPPLVFGSIMAFYQMAKGAHFLGHNITTMLLAFLMAHGIYLTLQMIFAKYKVKKTG